MVTLGLIASIILPTLDGPQLAPQRAQREAFNEGWTLTTNLHPEAVQVTLPHHVYPDVEHNEVVTITNIIPELPFDDIALQTVVFQRPLSITVDGQLIYEYNPDVDGIKESPGSINLFLPLDSAKPGSRVEISYIQRVPRENSRIQKIYLMDAITPLRSYPNLPPLFIVALFASFGLGLILLLLPLTGRFRYKPIVLSHIGAFFLMSSIWISANTKLLQVFVPNILLLHKLEMISFYSIPLFLWSIYYYQWPKLRKIVVPVLVVMLFFFLTALSLDAFNYLDVFYSLSAAHQLVFINAIFLLGINIYAFLKKIENYEVMIIGSFGLVLVNILDISVHLSYNNTTPIVNYYIYAALGLGSLFWFAYWRGSQMHTKDRITQQLKQELALIHPISQASNLKKLRMDLANGAINDSMILLVFHLEDLKQYSDNYGFQAGDEQIQKFVSALQETFQAYGLVYHVFANTYYVYLEHKHEPMVPVMVDRLQTYRKVVQLDTILSFQYEVEYMESHLQKLNLHDH